MSDESYCIAHEPCPKCGSSDNLARYTDGHAYCFSMMCDYYEPPTDRVQHERKDMSKKKGSVIPFDEIDIRPLEKRKIDLATCEKFKYGLSRYKNKPVQVAPYFDEHGVMVAQKLRFPDKDFTVLGDLKKALPLFGQHLWRDEGKKVIITEGEIDALSVSKLQGNKYPVVSVPNGAQGAAKAIAKAIEWLCKFDEVIFMFDMDEPGRDATIECAQLLPPGKAKLASLPLKDANEMLVAGRGKEVISAIWDAKAYRPDGLVSLSDLKSEVLKPVEFGIPWAWDFLTQATYGRREGEVYGLGAGTGVGKTDLLTQQIAYDITEIKQPVGLFFFEQQPKETLLRVAGKVAHKRFHIPDDSWTEDELMATIEQMEKSGQVYLYNHWGGAEWVVVKSRMRFLALQGVKLFYVDHLTAMAAAADLPEKEALEELMAEVASLAQELKIIVHLVSHLTTPEGKPHEEGGRVMIRHFKGSRAIGFWCYFMFGLERNQQAKDEDERKRTVFRILKDRYTGKSTGLCHSLDYDVDTGILTDAGVFVPRQRESQRFSGDAGEQDF